MLRRNVLLFVEGFIQENQMGLIWLKVSLSSSVGIRLRLSYSDNALFLKLYLCLTLMELFLDIIELEFQGKILIESIKTLQNNFSQKYISLRN